MTLFGLFIVIGGWILLMRGNWIIGWYLLSVVVPLRA